jgi:5,10-methylenetetrahydromethanopterin reductase
MAVTFGITYLAADPPKQFIDLVRLAEDSGFDYVWVAATSLYARDVYAYLTLGALHTRRVRLGPNCTHPYTRHPAINFNIVATIDELSHGRAVMNLGAGGGTMKELGYKVAPLRDVRDMIMLGRKLFSGQAIEDSVQGLPVKGAKLRFAVRKDLPIYVTASGPRMLQLAGELCDGVVFMAGVDTDCVRYAVENVKSGAESAGRQVTELDIACCVFGALGEDRTQARDACRAIAAWFVQSQPNYVEVAGIPKAQAEAIREAFSGSAHGPESKRAAALVTEEMIDKFTLAGNAADFRARIEQVLETGVQHIEFFPEGEGRAGMTRIFGEQVLPHFK